MASYDGHGTTLTFSTLTAALKSIGAWGISVETINVSNMSTSEYHAYIAATLKEGGEFSAVLVFAGEAASLVGTEATCTIDWGGLGSTWSGSAIMTGFEVDGASSGEEMTATATFKINGAVSFA